jgi:GNAT superfamily N-acetyltransferase
MSVIAAPKKIHRRRRVGELTVEQTHDASAIAAMLAMAGIKQAADFVVHEECFLLGYWGDDPTGIAGLETEVDAALVCPLFVLESMRRRGVGAALMRAARLAAYSRGARMLYTMLPAAFGGFLVRYGFAEVTLGELTDVFGGAAILGRTAVADKGGCRVLRRDISRDGIIER